MTEKKAPVTIFAETFDENDWGNTMDIYEVKEEIVRIGEKLYNKGLVVGKGGNITARYGDVVISTPTGKSLEVLDVDDLPIFRLVEGISVGKSKPTSELPMHIGIYKTRPDINYIIHAHPPKITAYAVAGFPLQGGVLPEIFVKFGDIPIAEYKNPATESLSDVINRYALTNNEILMANHGVVVMSKDSLIDAYYNLETIESYAEICIFAKILNRINTIPVEDLDELKRVYYPATAK